MHRETGIEEESFGRIKTKRDPRSSDRTSIILWNKLKNLVLQLDRCDLEKLNKAYSSATEQKKESDLLFYWRTQSIRANYSKTLVCILRTSVRIVQNWLVGNRWKGPVPCTWQSWRSERHSTVFSLGSALWRLGASFGSRVRIYEFSYRAKSHRGSILSGVSLLQRSYIIPVLFPVPFFTFKKTRHTFNCTKRNQDQKRNHSSARLVIVS